MARDEVRERIGSPRKTYRVDPTPGVTAQTVEVWLYTYSGREISPGEFVAGVLLLAAVFVVTVAAIKGSGGGGLSGLGGGGGASAEGYCFYIGFGIDGLVREVTMVEPVRR